jgi:prepilin-type N-terminal cleavage/methylation domain-containing protein
MLDNTPKAARRINTAAGFTLIEVLMALAIFAIGFLAIASLQATYIGENASARLQTEATATAVQILEQLRALPFDHDGLDPAANPHQPPAGSIIGYNVQWFVADNSPVNNTKTVTITVSPQNRVSGRPVRMRTIIAE